MVTQPLGETHRYTKIKLAQSPKPCRLDNCTYNTDAAVLKELVCMTSLSRPTLSPQGDSVVFE